MAFYEKLVRDLIPARLDAKGIPYERRTASEEEFVSALCAKLLEEVHEFLEAGGDPEELADVLEVLKELLKLPQYALVEELRLRKRAERGGFDKHIILKGEK